jgi:hypothetical protein
MRRFDILTDGQLRYVHSTDDIDEPTIITTLVKVAGGFVEEGHEHQRALTLRQWKARLARRIDAI